MNAARRKHLVFRSVGLAVAVGACASAVLAPPDDDRSSDDEGDTGVVVSPVNVSFGGSGQAAALAVKNVRVGKFKSATVIVGNTSGASITVFAELKNASGPWSIASNGCSTLAPKAKCSIALKYAPTTHGATADTTKLLIAPSELSDASDGGASASVPTGTLTVSLSGSALLAETLWVWPTGTGSGKIVGGPVLCPGTCTGKVDWGTTAKTVFLKATPSNDSTFTSWGGACAWAGKQTSCTVTMNAARRVTATFAVHESSSSSASDDGGTGSVTQIGVGHHASFARLSDGTVKAWGAVGLSGSVCAYALTPTTMTELSDVAEVRAGGTDAVTFGCARLTNGTVTCWSSNGSFGELGDGTADARCAPGIAVSGISGALGMAAQISVGKSHACATMTTNTVRCWGLGTLGQLGNNDISSSQTPVIGHNISDAIQVEAALQHSCARSSGGGVMCWGTGILSTGTEADPTAVSLSGSAIDIGVAQTRASCAVISGGTVQCWGVAAQGQLGDGANTGAQSPVATIASLAGVTKIAMRDYGGCALLSGGTVKCWGLNSSGQAGQDPSTAIVSPPATVAGLTGVTQLAGGGNHTCALLSTGAVKCWGINLGGVLGDGTTTNSEIPVTAIP